MSKTFNVMCSNLILLLFYSLMCSMIYRRTINSEHKFMYTFI